MIDFWMLNRPVFLREIPFGPDVLSFLYFLILIFYLVKFCLEFFYLFSWKLLILFFWYWFCLSVCFQGDADLIEWVEKYPSFKIFFELCLVLFFLKCLIEKPFAHVSFVGRFLRTYSISYGNIWLFELSVSWVNFSS